MTALTSPTVPGPAPAGPAAPRRELHTGWTVRAVAGPVPAHLADRLRALVPATVPGVVHTDLLAAGLVPDPYLDDNEHVLAWIGRCDWEYRTTFEWAPDGHERHDLVADGLDTVATVTLNGHVLAETANQHRTYRLPVDGLLRPGTNELVVRFSSPLAYAAAQNLAMGYRPHTNPHPFNAIRKMACSFGWDWGLETATSGIWRPLALEAWSGARLATVRPVATVVDPGTAVPADQPVPGRLAVHVDVERSPGHDRPDGPQHADLHVAVHVDGLVTTARVPAGETSTVVDVDLPVVRRWWPRGYGEQPLYEVAVELLATPGAAGATEPSDGSAPPSDASPAHEARPAVGPLDVRRHRVGFRTVRLDMLPDEHDGEPGTSFVIVVNERPVFVRGANWIPDDAFPHRVTRERYAARITQAEQANVNLLRVWGGGIYEADDFYDLCDERGILTWQDFLFACSTYAEEEPLRGEVEAEVRDNVVRLAPHPSLVLWNGNNENLWGFHDWDWQLRLQGRTWGLGYYTELLPALLAELDPGRPYTPGSPWSGTLDLHPNLDAHGSVHVWDAWNRKGYEVYRDHVARFVAEFGWQGPPTWSTLRDALSDDPLTPESPGMLVHQKAAQGNDKLTDGLLPHFPLPDDMDDWHWAMSLNQANAMTVGIEHMRSWSPRCAGAVVWQLNDCWPVTSWAAVDGAGRAKPTLSALRHAYRDRLVTVQPRRPDGGAPLPGGASALAVVVVNDSPDPWSGTLVQRRVRYDGTVLAEAGTAVGLAPRETRTLLLPDDVASAASTPDELVVATLGDERGLWFFAEPRDSALVDDGLDVAVREVASGVEVPLPVPGSIRGPAPDAGPGVGHRYEVTVTARTLVRDVTLLVDKVHPGATVDDQLVTLLPGERATFTVSVPAALGPEAPLSLTARRVLRTANQLVAGPSAQPVAR
ncbi:glycoside hydrolase family 2 protein [Oerskovia sp. Sa1BUA8]|uniref:beta-mannosidase n=2 Tax=Oerskovia douganii TaxID=2762210 RepID=A0A9D5UJP0_9CELL|nr:glycoside hydrolase family 2 protein [Oerskovia douganii]